MTKFFIKTSKIATKQLIVDFKQLILPAVTAVRRGKINIKKIYFFCLFSHCLRPHLKMRLQYDIIHMLEKRAIKSPYFFCLFFSVVILLPAVFFCVIINTSE